MLSSSFLWINSLLPEQAGADEATLIARDAAAQSHRGLNTKGVAVKPMMYEALLTASQHQQIIEKVCTRFEDEALHLTDRHQWLALKPKEQQWIGARQIIQQWDLTMRICCKQDLKHEEFEKLEKAILYGDAMDAHILEIIERFPKKLPHRHDPGHAH
jgi:hypothetical protein